jgi:hypothetical protein
MGVYVDNMLRPARVGRIQSRWSHLIADTPEELRAFAARLGMRPEWVQYPGHPREHYDLTEPKRAKAIELGAVQITYPHGIAELIARKKAAQVDGTAAPLLDDGAATIGLPTNPRSDS